MLGFPKNNAEKTLDHAISESNESLSVEQLIKIALKSL
jgi:Holliday junction DNA helicase RuvA